MKRFCWVIALMGAFTFFANDGAAQCHASGKAGAGEFSYHAPDQNIVEIAAGSEDFTTLVAAVKAAGLVETLQSDGPFTVFAPTNTAFEKLPHGTVNTLLEPRNKSSLTNILTYHVVAGQLDAKAVVTAIERGNGKAEVTTVNGGTLTATLRDGNVYLIDENSNLAKVTTVDLRGTNGVIHVIDTVIMPE